VNSVSGDLPVTGQDVEAFCLSLSDEHPIEGVTMKQGEASCLLAVIEGDGQLFESLSFNNTVKVVWRGNLANTLLDGNLPSRSSTWVSSRISFIRRSQKP